MTGPARLRRRYGNRPRYGYFPTLIELENRVKIMVYARDASHGPHIQVAYKGDERNPTRLRISDGALIDERPSVKRPDLAEARKWLAANRVGALEAWVLLNPPVVRRKRH